MVNIRVGMMGLVCSGSIIGDAQTKVIGQSLKVTGTAQRVLESWLRAE